MAQTEVQAVRTKQQQNDFLHLPWKIYAGDANWIPPLRTHQKEVVGFAKHPFYDVAQIQTFVAYQNGKAVGRIAAILNPGHIERYDESLGFWGFFESIDDSDVSQALFEAVREWFRGHGIEQLRGPCNPSLNHEVGLLVDGFEHPPTFMMTYNPSYYPDLVEQAGFEKCQDMYAFWGHVDMLEALDKKLAFVVEESTRRFNISVRTLDRKRFSEEVRMFLHIYNRSLVDTWGFVPMSDAEVDHMAAGMKHLIVPEMTSFAEVDGKVVGAMLGLLDFNPRIKKIDGRLFPFGFFHLLWNRKALKKVRMISTNVLPEYQKWGVGLVLVARLVPDILAWGIEEAEFSWVLESNHLSRKTLERGGAVRQKTYRIYDG